MNPIRILTAIFAVLLLSLTACKKQNNSDNPNNNGSCNNTVMKFKKLQLLGDIEDYLEAEWNTNGTPKKVKMNLPLSELLNATYVYESGRIKQAVIKENYSAEIYDTAIYHYDSGGRIDSLYLKNEKSYNIKLTYSNGKLTKYTRYLDKKPVIYWNIESDAKGNVTKAEEWMDLGSGFEKQSTFTFTRDDRKNPVADLAPYMIYLDDIENILSYWGPNNFVDQNYQDHTGSGINLTTGRKFKYNVNCYPGSSQTTISGIPVLNEDDSEYTYY